MKKLTIIIALMLLLVYIAGACSSQFGEDVIAPSGTQSCGLPEFSDSKRQYAEVLKSIKFEKDTFYLGITFEEAMRRGVPEEKYNRLLKRLEEYTIQAREILATGGTFVFVNGLSQNYVEPNNFDSPNRLPISPNYGGWIGYPGFNRGYIHIPSQHADGYKGVSFSCNAHLVMKAAGGDYTGFVWHQCNLSGKDKKGNTVNGGINQLGSPAALAMPIVPFPGLLGDSAEEHTIVYIAKLDNEKGGDSLVSAWCDFKAVTYL